MSKQYILWIGGCLNTGNGETGKVLFIHLTDKLLRERHTILKESVNWCDKLFKGNIKRNGTGEHKWWENLVISKMSIGWHVGTQYFPFLFYYRRWHTDFQKQFCCLSVKVFFWDANTSSSVFYPIKYLNECFIEFYWTACYCFLFNSRNNAIK